ncbi:hypothetical protein BKI52_15690 [marine bacterium AO1-C]|nr:hypothetical protein BKI52_15690 [marine bacterium AO1-C]
MIQVIFYKPIDKTMQTVTHTLHVKASSATVFTKFVNELNEWWPKAYTWSQDTLAEIRIDAQKDGLCTEIGPYGFRCDWGRVTEITPYESLGLKWQISPKREPIPDPTKASDIRMSFEQEGEVTKISLEHYNFELHGEEGDNYCQMMASEYGWPYIFNCFKTYCES